MSNCVGVSRRRVRYDDNTCVTSYWRMTADYYSLHTQRKLHHCVTDVRRQYPIAPLFRGDLTHAQTMCTRLSLHDPQNVSGGESGNKARIGQSRNPRLVSIKLFINTPFIYVSFYQTHFCRTAFFHTSKIVMPQFRWPQVENDISLAREVVGQRPSRPADWDIVAVVLSSAFSTPNKPVHLRGRGCRERMDRLIEKFRADDTQSLKR